MAVSNEGDRLWGAIKWLLPLIGIAVLLAVMPPLGAAAAVAYVLVYVLKYVGVGDARGQALFRLLAVVYAVTLWPFVLAIGLLAGGLYMVLDVLSRLIWGSGVDASQLRGVAGWLTRIMRWPIDQLRYILLGEPDRFPATP
ncbi:hypothetical protein [Halobiforma nitratireducens]|uniref:Uncharacterized protein n=1 Tax=Halobiforma nitratireducens JCM 10879 TaxID=1227454 RepID=M0MLB2_9EURY|nr:hypothetical protein [Halobiforma nitratireducens]EMA45240.1 hypothetical protein C446_02502 [Halobiforma nitratireducens JCM 10879]